MRKSPLGEVVLADQRGSGKQATPKTEMGTVMRTCCELCLLLPSLSHTANANRNALNLRYVTEFKAFLIRLVLMLYQRSQRAQNKNT